MRDWSSACTAPVSAPALNCPPLPRAWWRTSNTFIQLPEIKLGLLPGAGGTVSILRRIGRHRTAYLALSARRISAATALQWGLVDAII